ncbi:MAG TPA: hypothetical protein PLA68_14580 [Panacibacter sp.]|nr:hypothetical protein [Panacibacter sp.]
MDGLQIENNSSKLVLSIEKGSFSESVLLKVMKVARLEYLLEKAGFNESLLQLDEEIKESWWQQNKEEILAKAKQ